jgi:histidinol-phosphate aminotransferase
MKEESGRPEEPMRPAFRAKPSDAVSRMSPYVPSPSFRLMGEGLGDILKMDANEADVRPSPVVFERISEFLGSGHLNWYPEFEASVLRRKISEYAGRPIETIRVFNGSDSALDHVCRTFVGRGDHVVVSAPTYDHFRVFAETLGARAEFVFGASPFESNTEELARAVTPATKLVYLCNPNNPTGRTYGEEDVRRLLDRLENGILLVDEAYFEFAKITMAGLLDGYPHLVISRTFSKAFGLAGLRCGYILADEACVRLIDRIRNGKDVNALAQVAAVAALEDAAYMERFVAEALAAKLWLAGRLRSLGFEVVTTPANFLLLKTQEPRSLARELEDRGVFIRDRSGVPQLDRCLRITVGSFEHCRRLMEILERHAPES